MLPAGSLNQAMVWTIPAHDPFLVRLVIGQIVSLKADATLFQFVYGEIDISHREIENVNAAGT